MPRHIPVLLNEVIQSLDLKSGDNIIDCTLGDGGHAEKILEATAPDGKLLGIDTDPESLLRAKQFLNTFENRVIFVRDNFEHIKKIVEEESFTHIQGILFDLGWSMPQFEERKRGFSFQKRDEPLDMRYDTRMDCEHKAVDPPLGLDGKPLYGRCTAAEYINMKSEQELEYIFKKFGEEKYSKEIAKNIVGKRKEFVLKTVGDLVDIVLEVYRKKIKTDKEIPYIGGLHPVTKVFQALRILVNDELNILKNVLPQAVDLLEPGGRIAVVSFHSLEDGIVKHFFKSQKNNSLTIITKKPITCGEEECRQNPRARSAKLRVAEKI